MPVAMAEQPRNIEHDQSFDVLASVYLYQYDVLQIGYVRQETKQRVYNEELTFVAEGLNRPLDTSFDLQAVGGQLAIFHRGEWRPYVAMLERGLRTAAREAITDPRKSFLVEWATRDLLIGKRFDELRPGQSFSWYSEFPEAVYERYGEHFTDSLGLQSNRRMGFLYRATKKADGSLTLRTKSVDNSDPDAFQAAMEAAQQLGSDIEDSVVAYDRCKTAKDPDHEAFHAGRRSKDVIPEENAWTLIERHKDLVGFYFSNLEMLSRQQLPQAEIVRAKKRLTYGFWASLKERLDSNVLLHDGHRHHSTLLSYAHEQIRLQAEYDQAYAKLSRRGELLPGCGGSISGEAAVLSASSEDVFDSIFGKATDRFGSLQFKCPNGHLNTRPRGQKIPKCQHQGCNAKVAC